MYFPAAVTLGVNVVGLLIVPPFKVVQLYEIFAPVLPEPFKVTSFIVQFKAAFAPAFAVGIFASFLTSIVILSLQLLNVSVKINL